MSVQEVPALEDQAVPVKSAEAIRIEILERMLMQLKTELQNCQTVIANQLSHSQNLNMLIELTNKELSGLVKQSLQ